MGQIKWGSSGYMLINKLHLSHRCTSLSPEIIYFFLSPINYSQPMLRRLSLFIKGILDWTRVQCRHLAIGQNKSLSINFTGSFKFPHFISWRGHVSTHFPPTLHFYFNFTIFNQSLGRHYSFYLNHSLILIICSPYVHILLPLGDISQGILSYILLYIYVVYNVY